MRKQDIRSLIVYIILLVAIFLGSYFGVIMNSEVRDIASQLNNSFLPVAWAILTIVGSLVVASIVLELGHLLGAKVGKYDVISFNFLSLTFYKKEGKTKFKISSPDGLLGETMVAPRVDEKGEIISKPKAMLWFGNLFLATLVVVGAILFVIFQEQTKNLISPISLLAAVTIGSVLFYNMIPLELDNKTDGDQLRIIAKPSNIPAYNELLRVTACEVLSIDPGESKVFEEITNYTAAINNVTIYKLLGEEKYDEALRLVNHILNNEANISTRAKLEFQTQKLYILLYTNQIEKAKKLYEDEISLEDRRLISNINDIIFIRTHILISTYLDPAESEVQYATSRADKAYKKVETLKKPVEELLYKNALKRTKEIHPSWEVIVQDKK